MTQSGSRERRVSSPEGPRVARASEGADWPVWVGVDVGTQGVRAAAYDNCGHLVADAMADRPARTPEPGAMVHDADTDWWGGSQEVLSAVVVGLGGRPVAGIGLSGLFPAVVLADETGLPMSEAILHGDTRAHREVQELSWSLGLELTGDEVAPRLLWLGRHRPDQVARSRLALGPAGYVGLRLTGEPSIDPHSAGRWGVEVSPSGQEWGQTRSDQIGVAPSALPPIRRPTDVVGRVTQAAARATGLQPGVPVVAGTTDSLALLIGDGATRVGDAIVYYGSSGTLMVCTTSLDEAIRDPTLFGNATPYRLAAYALNSGILAEHLRTELFGGATYEALDMAAADIAPGAAGLMVVPHVSGRFLPYLRPPGSGAFVGMSLAHGRGHLWRAVLESFGFALLEAQAAMEEEPRSTIAAGGGSESATWRQIVSDMTGWTQFVAPPGGSARGAAALAALGVGGHFGIRSLSEVRDIWLAALPASGTTQPRPGCVETYRPMLRRWQAYDSALASVEADGEPTPTRGRDGSTAFPAGPEDGLRRAGPVVVTGPREKAAKR